MFGFGIIKPFSVPNWINILSPIKGKNILRIGTRNREMENALMALECKSLKCKGIEILGQQKHSQPDYGLGNLYRKEFDLAIIDESQFLENIGSLKDFKKLLSMIFDTLNDTGCFLMGFPNKMKFIKYLFFCKYLLIKKDIGGLNIYLCYPSFGTAFIIQPLTLNSKKGAEFIIETPSIGYGFMEKMKKIIKYFLIKISLIPNRSLGIALLLRKAEAKENLLEEKLLLSNSNYMHLDCRNIHTIWVKRYVGKRVGLIYYQIPEDLIAICKKVQNEDPRSYLVKKEHDNLKSLTKVWELLAKRNIQIPRALNFENISGAKLSIESACAGRSLDGLYCLEKYNRQFEEVMDKVVCVLIELHKVINARKLDNIWQVPQNYLEDQLNLPAWRPGKCYWLHQYSKIIQHGDFTDVNIIYDGRKKRWGIIDWEFLGGGYPFLFDLFNLFSCFEFCDKVLAQPDNCERLIRSHLDTFFRKNWFSNIVRKAIIKYSMAFQINARDGFVFYMDYLLLRYHRYRLEFHDYRHCNIYKEIMNEAVRNRQGFLTEL